MVTKNRMVTLAELHDYTVYGDGRNLEKENITATLHQYTLYDGMARLHPFLSEDIWKPTWNLKEKKTPKGISDCKKQDSLVW